MTESNAVAFPSDFAPRKAYCIRTIAPLVTGSYRQDGENYSRFDLTYTYVVAKDS